LRSSPYIEPLAVILTVALTAVSAPAQPQERDMGGIVGITAYDDRDFRGRNANFRNDVADLRPSGMNDRIVSFEIARGETWEVCEHVSFGGRCQVFTGYENDLRQRGWARMISSMRRIRGGGGGGYPPPILPPVPGGPGARGLELFASENFRGSSRVLNGPTSDLRVLGFSDKAESLRLPRGEVWEVCRDVEYVGCLQVNSDWPDLGRLGRLKGEISSARPWRQGGSGWNPGPRPPYPGSGASGRIVLYSAPDFRGRSRTLDRADGAVDMGAVQSVRVERGATWQICEDTNFRGRCTAVSGDVADIRSFGLPGRVRSARPTASPR
jgi:hypothetical protein